MAFVNIPLSDLEVDDPIKASHMQALMSNFAALANGESGAPSIQTAALADGSVTAAKLGTGASITAWVGERTAALGVGVIGAYGFLASTNGTQVVPGDTKNGSNLLWAGVSRSSGDFGDGGNTDGQTRTAAGNPNGVWMCCGWDASASGSLVRGATLFRRIS